MWQAQNERADNNALRSENERIHCENIAMREALNNIICPNCHGSGLGAEEKQHSLQRLRMENTRLKEEVIFPSQFIFVSCKRKSFTSMRISLHGDRIVFLVDYIRQWLLPFKFNY